METNLEQSNEEIANIELGSALARIHARGRFKKLDAEDFIPTPESPLLYIDTPYYDGPLDLLLHLIRKHSMDIFDIPIVTITKKYLEALEDMSALNLDVAGEFLVMAATLAEIKSKMLLPKEERVQEGEEEEGEDPRIELMKRLLLYKSFQEASQELLQRPLAGHDWFTRPIPQQETQDLLDPNLEFKDIALSPVEIYELVETLHGLIKQSENLSVHTITRDRISVSARLHDLLEFCQVRQKFTFYDALKFFSVYEKIDVIVTFLAILEMSRLKLVKINHDAEFDLAVNIIKEHFYAQQKEILNNLSHAQGEVEYD